MSTKIEKTELEIIIDDILQLSGITSNLKGYTYIKEAISIAYSKPETFGMVTKMIYPEIAEKHNLNSNNIEIRIRTAIEKAWKQGEVINFYKKMGFQWMDRRPTNSEYIFMVVEYLNNL